MATSSPGPIGSLLLGADHLLAGDPVLANALLAAAETAVGVALVAGLATPWALSAMVPLFLAIWSVGQGFGLPLTPGTTDLNSGLVYVLLAAALLRGRCWTRWSVDAWAAADRPASPGAAARPRRAAVRLGVAGAGLLGLAALTTVSVLARAGSGAAPQPVAGAALALDPATGSVVLFGGCGPLVCSVATWTWDGRRWRARHPRLAPPPRGDGAMAAEPGTADLVLIGGSAELGAGPSARAAWAWDGRDWRRLPGRAPGPRRFPALAADPRTGQLLLFGGDDGHGHVLGGTWIRRADRWTEVTGGLQPPPRTGAAMAYDPALGGVLLFGGNGGGGRLDDTWLWSGRAWSRLHPATRPPPRAYLGMATDPRLRTVVLFTGAGSPGASTWTYGPHGWVPHPGGPIPPTASFASLATAPGGRGVALFGGLTVSGYSFGASSAGYGGQLWLWNGRGWRVAPGSALAPHPGDD